MKKGVSKTLTVFFLLFSCLVYLTYPYQVEAFEPIGPFGGQILLSRPCFDGFLLTLGPPAEWQFMYVPFETLTYLVGPPIIETQWVLGQSIAPIICLNPVDPFEATPLGWGNYIVFEGASTPTGI